MGNMNANAGLYEQRLGYQKNAAPRQPLALPWWPLTPEKTYLVRHCCSIEPKICGEEVFKAIAQDIEKAQHSVDILTWGFDPGMVLIRGGSAESGQRYGDLLKQVATRKDHPVQVRLLVWHDDAGSDFNSRNMPGYHRWRFPFIGGVLPGYYSEAHQTFNAEWLAQVLAGTYPNITLHVRKVDVPDALASLKGETPPKGAAVEGAKLYPSHHQKMVLIDYEDPAIAVGYVMGHNSITDYWDTAEHHFQDKRRESIFEVDPIEARRQIEQDGEPLVPALGDQMDKVWQAIKYNFKPWEDQVQAYLDHLPRQVSKPYQDVSARLRGEILCDINANFCEAWRESAPPPSQFLDYAWTVPKFILRARALARSWMPVTPGELLLEYLSKKHPQPAPRPPDEFILRRMTIRKKEFRLKDGQHSVQLVRTQPKHREKTIKECYANLTRQMQHYIFIQNQYVQYEDWADHLLDRVKERRKWGDHRPIYVFILTSTPEMSGMDRPTYSIASKLGQSESMQVEHTEVTADQIIRGGPAPVTPAELAQQGINVVMGSLWTCARKPEGTKLKPEDYEEIYIHAKVAIVDDAAFTLGSANLNLRSMAMDSELNIISQAQDVAFKLRKDLFLQCAADEGDEQFRDMRRVFKDWLNKIKKNKSLKDNNLALASMLGPFEVYRNPGMPVI